MKRLLISTLLMIGLTSPSIAQKNSFGVSAGIGSGFIMKRALEGGPGYDLNTGVSIGFLYERQLASKLYFQTGINWYNNTLSVTPSFSPDIDMTPKDYAVRLLYVPLLLSVDLSKYWFVNGGVIADLDVAKNKYITNQSGIGVGLGTGIEFAITDKLAIQLNPYLNFHGVFLSMGENYPERVVDSGLKLNLVVK